MQMPRRGVSIWANTISVVATWFAGIVLLVILFMMAIEATSTDHSAYTGILTFVALPALMLLSLAVAVFGALWERRRRQRSGLPPETYAWPILDLNSKERRRNLILATAVTVLFLGLSSFGSFKAYEYTESNSFCGTMCHAVMHPEYTAYQASPHARVHCVDCHIGPGAKWFVKSKITGAYQVYAVLADVYPRPIHTPIKGLRPSRDTCEQCHWPTKFHGDLFVEKDYFLSDDENTHKKLNLLMKVGGGTRRKSGEPGIHWHTDPSNRVEYFASDDRRQEIPWVRVTRADGSVSVFTDEDAGFDPAEVVDTEVRTMDCIDCHNRPSHRYRPPFATVNEAMADGRISPTLPGVKALAVELLDDEYETTEQALEAIRDGMQEAYSDEDPAIVEAATTALTEIYQTNFFPTMKADYRAHPHNIGHLSAPGCFRCHNGSHVDDEGNTLGRECNTCHVFLEPGTGPNGDGSALHEVEFEHPEDIDEAWREVLCTECHGL